MSLSAILAPRVIPVVVMDDPNQAEALGEALVAGHLPVVEITFRTPVAAEVIRTLARRGDVLVGAGTIVRPEQVDVAAEAGAGFIVCPGLRADVVGRCADHGLPVIPGAVTATEVMAALALGLSTLKFFPASAVGGVPALKALAAPFPEVRFIPTGGVSADNLSDYLSLPNVPAVGGSWMVDRTLMAAGDFGAIAGRSAAAVALAREVH